MDIRYSMTPKTAARTKATIIKTVEIERITPGTFLDQNGTWENENVRVHVEPGAFQLFSISVCFKISGFNLTIFS